MGAAVHHGCRRNKNKQQVHQGGQQQQGRHEPGHRRNGQLQVNGGVAILFEARCACGHEVGQEAVELGAARVCPIAAQRSVLQLAGPRLEKRVAHWQRIAQSAAEQCGRNRLMAVEAPMALADWLAAQPGTLPIRCAFVGRLVPYKGPDMLIEAAEPFLRDGTMVLDILGDGPLMPTLTDMVAQRGLSRAVTLHGWIDHKDVQSLLSKSQLLTFPSVREFGGGVVLEAMAAGTPVAAFDATGPRDVIPGSGAGTITRFDTSTESAFDTWMSSMAATARSTSSDSAVFQVP